jgi:hypothetical protein
VVKRLVNSAQGDYQSFEAPLCSNHANDVDIFQIVQRAFADNAARSFL